MFSSKTAEEVRAHDERLTGLERAKLERAQQPVPAVQAAPVFTSPGQSKPTASPAARVVVPPRPVPPVQPANAKAQLIVGSGVTVKGDILNCDLLRLEGIVEGDVKAHKLVVSAGGSLVGTAEIDDAEIEGRFEGTLSAGGLLVVRSTGRATGKFAYGAIEIERGGQIAGEMQVGKSAQPRMIEPKAPLRATVDAKI